MWVPSPVTRCSVLLVTAGWTTFVEPRRLGCKTDGACWCGALASGQRRKMPILTHLLRSREPMAPLRCEHVA
jgi:hypothetical protein